MCGYPLWLSNRRMHFFIVPFFESMSSSFAGLLVIRVFPKVHLMPPRLNPQTRSSATFDSQLSRLKKECTHDYLQAPGQERRRTAPG
jgi:hypothetical protein